jgi:hypothetical protein
VPFVLEHDRMQDTKLYKANLQWRYAKMMVYSHVTLCKNISCNATARWTALSAELKLYNFGRLCSIATLFLYVRIRVYRGW